MARKLTKKEMDWIVRLQDVFNDCPARFDFYTIGDADLRIVDREWASKHDLDNGKATRADMVYDTVWTGGQVHAVSG